MPKVDHAVRPVSARLTTALLLLAVAIPYAPAQQTAPAPSSASSYNREALRFLAGRTSAQSIPGTSSSRLSPAAAFSNARMQHATLSSAPGPKANSRDTTLSAPWQAIGPNQISTPAYGNVTGRITAISIDPNDPTGNTVYLGTTGGGVWKSTNAAGPASAVSFLPLTDTLPVFSANAGTSAIPSLSIGAISVQPGAGQTAAILAGTGDPNDATDSYYGSGILRSADGGSTWTLAQGSRDGVAGNHSFLGLGTAAFAWSTTTNNLVVAAISQSAEGTLVNAPDTTNSVMGLYVSTDAGITWKMAKILDGSQIVQTPLPSGANNGGNAGTSVVWNPLRQRFFAAVRFHGIYQSADGATWTRLTHQPGTGLTLTACPTNPGLTGSPDCPLLRSVLAVQPATGDLFALTVDRHNIDQGLWQDVCAPSGSNCASPDIAFATQLDATPLESSPSDPTIPQGDYNLALAAVPAGDALTTILYAGTTNVFRCPLTNGATSGCTLRNTTNSVNGCATPARVAPAQHTLATLALSQPLIFLGNDGGLWRSTDGIAQTGPACSAGDVTHFDNLNAALGSLAESISLAADPTSADTLLLGLGTNGTAFTSAASALAPWPQLAPGEGGFVAIDQSSPQNLYISTGPGVSIAHCASGASCTAADFTGQPTLGPTQTANDASLLDPPFLLDPAFTSAILIGTCRVYRGPAVDGTLWSAANALSNPFGGPPNTTCSYPDNPLVRSLAAAGPPSTASAAQNAGSTILYAGLAGALDGGGTLGGHLFGTAAGATAGPTTTWTDLALSPVTNDSGDGGLFNPAGFDISSLAADPHDATGQTVYATVMGFAGNGFNSPHVYRSLDGGGSWTNISANLPNAPANSVVVDPNDANTLYVALDTGVYVTAQVSTCAAANCWSVLGTGLPNAPVIDLVATPGIPTGDGRLGELRAATYGRGVWQIPLLTATAPALPAITLAPASLTFAAQQVATGSPAQSVTVSNTGNASLTLSTITATGDFAETDTCITASPLAINASCTVQVSFLPTAVGSRTGVLTVFGNVAGGQATVALAGTATAPAAIILNPIAITFPSTNVGDTSARINLTVSNTGGNPAALQTPTITGSDFHFSANTCGSSLPSQTGCTVSIVFQPTASGSRSGTFSITGDAGTQTASLTGTANLPPTDALSPLSLAFAPEVLNNSSSAQTVTLTNAGDLALTLIAAQITSGDFTAVNNCGNSLNGHSACTVAISFIPKSLGPQTGTLVLSDVFRAQTVSLSGTGLAPAGVSASPFNGLTFPVTPVGTSATAQTVTLTNNGGVPLSIASIALTGPFAIAAAPNTCGTILPASSACTLQIVFTPSASGPATGTLTLTDSAATSPQILPLTGTGLDFTLVPNGPSSVTVSSGTSAVFPFLLSSDAGTPGTATFTCLGAPVNAACNVTPANPTLGATTTISVTVATGLTSSAQAHPATRTPLLWLAAILPLGLLALRRRPFRAGPCFLLAALVALTGCAVSRAIPDAASPTSTPGGPTNPTPAGSYSIAVSATSAGLTRTVNVTLIVQ